MSSAKLIPAGVLQEVMSYLTNHTIVDMIKSEVFDVNGLGDAIRAITLNTNNPNDDLMVLRVSRNPSHLILKRFGSDVTNATNALVIGRSDMKKLRNVGSVEVVSAICDDLLAEEVSTAYEYRQESHRMSPYEVEDDEDGRRARLDPANMPYLRQLKATTLTVSSSFKCDSLECLDVQNYVSDGNPIVPLLKMRMLERYRGPVFRCKSNAVFDRMKELTIVQTVLSYDLNLVHFPNLEKLSLLLECRPSTIASIRNCEKLKSLKLGMTQELTEAMEELPKLHSLTLVAMEISSCVHLRNRHVRACIVMCHGSNVIPTFNFPNLYSLKVYVADENQEANYHNLSTLFTDNLHDFTFVGSGAALQRIVPDNNHIQLLEFTPKMTEDVNLLRLTSLHSLKIIATKESNLRSVRIPRSCLNLTIFQDSVHALPVFADNVVVNLTINYNLGDRNLNMTTFPANRYPALINVIIRARSISFSVSPENIRNLTIMIEYKDKCDIDLTKYNNRVIARLASK